jgi:hypothetical protein
MEGCAETGSTGRIIEGLWSMDNRGKLIMPKLHGSARKLGGILNALEIFANKHELTLTLEKVQRMQVRIKRDGFTSFAEN